MVDDFVAFVRSDGIREPFDENDVALTDEAFDEKAREDIRIYIKSDVAAAVWGGDTGREVLLRYDDQVMRTIELLPQAANLLTLASRSVAR